MINKSRFQNQILYKFFNDPILLNGIAVAIAKTEETEYETLFEIYKTSLNQITYPKKIFIGDENSVGGLGLTEVANKRWINDYCKKTGRKFHQSILYESEYLEFIEKERKKGRGDSIDFPYESTLNYNSNRIGLEKILVFHTHPNSMLPTPSPKDFETLKNEINDEYCNPIELIAGTNNVKETHQIIAYQAKESFSELKFLPQIRLLLEWVKFNNQTLTQDFEEYFNKAVLIFNPDKIELDVVKGNIEDFVI